MQNVMAATYPEMFAAGIAYSGTAAGCFYSQSGGVDAWNNSCANGQARGTPEVWAKVSSNRAICSPFPQWQLRKFESPVTDTASDGLRHVSRLQRLASQDADLPRLG